MPRIFSSAIQGEINKQFAGEPMLLVEIAWNGSDFIAYTDRKLNGADSPYPFVVNVGAFDTTTIVSGGSDSQNVNITLNDIDGSIREIIDAQDIHLRPVRIYLTFQGLPVAEKALMFEGVINSPIEWDESSRALSFDVFSKLEDAEAGFTMEDGDFPYVPVEDRNKAWPLIFGQICNMKGVRVTALRKGYLAQGVGVPDPTLAERLCQAYNLVCNVEISDAPTSPAGSTLLDAYEQGRRVTRSYISRGSQRWTKGDWQNIPATFRLRWYGVLDENNQPTGANLMPYENLRDGQKDPQCMSRRESEICTILAEKAAQEQYVVNPFVVRNGEDFPQGEEIIIKIGEVRFTGVMTGESFLASTAWHPQQDTIDNPVCAEVKDISAGYRYRSGSKFPTTIAQCNDGTGDEFIQDITDGAGQSWKYYNEFEKGSFIWLPPGTDVFLANESTILNIVSLIPGTVDQVAAYRTYGDTTLLTELDTDLYTVNTTDYTGYDVVEIELNVQLSTIEGEDWDDDIYVSFTSTVGPNPADTIQWLIEKYTDYTVDATSFAAVTASLTKYPSNFFIKSRPTVLQLIRDIAFQARCAIYIRDNIVYLVYLSTEPASIKTLTESDILTGTFKFVHTETEDLETRHEISWSEGEAGINKDDETDFEFVLKHNIPKYGIFPAEYNYYTQNTFDTIEKSGTFWMIRNSNTWRYVEFQTPIKHLNLDVFDCVTLNIAQFPNTKIIIEETDYIADTNTIRFKAWTPILSGTASPYYWAWPSQQSATALFPLNDAIQESGDGFDFEVIPPVGHILRGGYDPDTAQLATDGDKNPSDLDDTVPTIVCKLATGAEIADDVEPIIRISEPLANANFEDKLDNASSQSASSSSLDDKESKNACGDPGAPNAGCVYEVIIYYITPNLITTTFSKNCLDGGPCETGSSGVPCTGSQSTFCHSFGALFAAKSFRSQKAAEGQQLRDTCGYNTGETAVWLAGGITGIPSDGPYGECEDTAGGGDPNAPGVDSGQTMQPKSV